MKIKAYSLIKYTGKNPVFARIEGGAPKVEFKEGDVCFAEATRANYLCGSFKFTPIAPIDVTPQMLKTAQKGLKEKEKEMEKVRKEQAQTAKDEVKRRERRAGVEKELRELKHEYNLNKVSLEEYVKEKEEIERKHAVAIGAVVGTVEEVIEEPEKEEGITIEEEPEEVTEEVTEDFEDEKEEDSLTQ